jgi:hypothetical protein
VLGVGGKLVGLHGSLTGDYKSSAGKQGGSMLRLLEMSSYQCVWLCCCLLIMQTHFVTSAVILKQSLLSCREMREPPDNDKPILTM